VQGEWRRTLRQLHEIWFSPGMTVDDVRADVPWDLKVASEIQSFPVPNDEEINFLRRFSPVSSLPNQVATQLSTEHFRKQAMAGTLK